LGLPLLVHLLLNKARVCRRIQLQLQQLLQRQRQMQQQQQQN
jgi:hypothetical protein